jgi:hypothetical protein
MPIDLEEAAEPSAVVTAAVAVGTQYAIPAWNIGPNLIGECAYIVSRRDYRPRAIGEASLDVAAPLRFRGMQHVPALADEEQIPASKVDAAIKKYGIDPEKPNPATV